MNFGRLCPAVAAAIAFAASGLAFAQTAPTPAGTHLAVSVSFPVTAAAKPQDGRVILLLSRDLTREPKSHVAPNAPLDAPYMFGLTVDGLAPGAAAVLDDTAFGWPSQTLSGLPEGDYLVQAVLNRYETFHLADGRVLKLPPDKGEGQQWQSKPGNF